MSLNILLMAGIGDAWGVCFEYAPADIIGARLESWSYFAHHKYNLGNGRYSDDLQMHIAVAETILSEPPHDEMAFIRSFLNCYQRDPREGYAGHFYAFLQSVTDAEDFAKRMKPESEKSGAAMRSACLGIYADTTYVLSMAACQARTTHNTARGIAAAQASALMLHYFLYQKGNKTDLPDFLNDYIPSEDWRILPAQKIGHLGVESVRAALRALIQENSMTGLLKSIISCGGDTDTAATIAMAAASCSTEIENDLPENLLTGFENGTYGRDYVMALDQKLTLLARQEGALV